MNKPFLLSGAVVLTAAGIVFFQQGRRLETVSRSVAAPSAAPVSTAAAPAVRTWEPPPSVRPAPKGRLLDKLGERLVSSLTLEQTATFLEAADHAEMGLLSANAGLSAEERTAFEQKFAALRRERAALFLKQDLSSPDRAAALQSLDQTKSEWTAARLGEERMAKVEAARQASTRAGAERDAARAVSRISRAADLTTGQKDRLYAALLDRALHPPPAAAPQDESLQFRTSGSLREEPDVPRLGNEARAILTPEQWAAYEQSSTFPARQQAAMMSAMQAMLPAIITTMQEVIEEPEEK